MALAEPKVLFEAQYQGKYKGMVIKSDRTLEHLEGNNFKFQSKVKNMLGNINEQSFFELSPDRRMIAKEYRYDRKIFVKKSNQRMVFDWPKKTAYYTRKDRPERNAEHQIVPGMLDVSLYQLKLQRDLENAKKELRYVIVKPNKIKLMEFALSGTESIELMGSSLKTLKLERVNSNDSSTTTIWVIPQLNHQIGRIDHKDEDGDAYQITLSKFESNETELVKFYALSQ